MVPSKYNFFVEQENGQYLAYNARTNALVMLDKARYEAFKDFSRGKIGEDKLPDKNDWLRGGFLVEDPTYEKHSLRFGLWKSRFDTRSYSLTIAPTLACNFKCVYCYEKSAEISKSMDEKVQSAIIKNLEVKLPTINKYSVTWYGGEPLLCMDVIRNLSKSFIEKCNEAKVEYGAFIVSNGYLLTPEVATELVDLKVGGVQITIDGTRTIHNSRRPLAGGAPTFDIILNNISKSSEIIPIVIRINIDKKNYKHNDELLRELKEKKLHNKVSIYLGWVEPSNNCYSASTCMSNGEFSEEKLRFAAKLIELGFNYDAMFDYPSLHFNACGADMISSTVIAPNGDTYACWSDIGIVEYRMGSILDSSVTVNRKRFYDYMLYDPTNDPECMDCVYLPICMGGCPKRRIDKNAERCVHVKSNLQKYLQNSAKLILEQRAKAKEESSAADGCETCASYNGDEKQAISAESRA